MLLLSIVMSSITPFSVNLQSRLEPDYKPRILELLGLQLSHLGATLYIFFGKIWLLDLVLENDGT